MSEHLRFGVWAPVYGTWASFHHPEEPVDASWDRTSALIRDAERLGYETALIAQHLINPFGEQHDQLETWTATAALAALTERIELIAAVKPYLHHPVVLAKQAAQIEEISRGRFGINLVNADLMRLRAFTPAVHGFLDTIREGHPSTPLLVISPLHCPIHEDTPGPCAPDFSTGQLRFRATGDPAERAAGKLTLGVIRDELARIVAQRAVDDPNLHHLDGRELYGEADAEAMPLPDRLHPDAATHRHIAERFAELVFTGGPFAA